MKQKPLHWWFRKGRSQYRWTKRNAPHECNGVAATAKRQLAQCESIIRALNGSRLNTSLIVLPMLYKGILWQDNEHESPHTDWKETIWICTS